MEKNVKKGLTFGALVGLAWGLDTVLMGVVGARDVFVGEKSTSLVSAFLHDGFCFIWLAIIMMLRGKVKSILSLLKSKKGRISMMGALIGAPLGMSGYVIGIQYAAPASASSLSVIYPGVGAILSYFILKEKLSLRAITGIALSIAGSAALGYSKVDLSLYPHFYKGMAFTGLAVIGWSLEGVIIAYAMKKVKVEEKVEATPEEFLTLRYLTSFAAYALAVIPAIGGYPLVAKVAASGEILYFAGIATLGVITYLSWYKAVNYVGAAMGTALNSTAAFWAIIFSRLILGSEISLYLAVCSSIIILGVFIFAVDPRDLIRRRRIEVC